MIPFVAAGEACMAVGTCVAGVVSAPAWAGVAAVTLVTVGTVYVVSNVIKKE